MAVTTDSPTGDSPDLTLLNVSRLFTRLEHNLLSPGSELRTLRQFEFQRMRVNKVRCPFTVIASIKAIERHSPLDMSSHEWKQSYDLI